MTTDLCTDDVVVHIGGPQIISSEMTVTSCSPGRAHVGVGGGGVGAELGRKLLVAAREGDTVAVLELMAKGTPFTTDWLGTSPLHLAASNAHLETCAVLLRGGVSRDSRTKVDRTPLHLAAYEGHEQVVSLLLEHGALVDCRDMLRMTPLHWAAQRGHTAAARELLRRGADPLAVSKFGATPLSLAGRSPLGEGSGLARLLEDAARAREAARSVRALVSEQNMSETQASEPQLQTFETLQSPKKELLNVKTLLPVRKVSQTLRRTEIQESDSTQKQTKPTQQQEQQDRTNSTRAQQPSESGAESESESGEAAAAQLLRRHGITLLPPDHGTTVLSALRSGRSVVLSDAGKLMLKESVEKPATSTSGKGVVLTATPVKSPPRAGVKIFTLNNNLLLSADPSSTKRVTTPQNLQVKYVQLPSESGAVGAGVTRGKRSSGTQRPVKIILNRANFTKLVSPLGSSAAVNSPTTSTLTRVDGAVVGAVPVTATGAVGGQGEGEEEEEEAVRQAESVLRITDEWVVHCSHKQLRAHATHARQALATLLRHYRATR